MKNKQNLERTIEDEKRQLRLAEEHKKKSNELIEKLQQGERIMARLKEITERFRSEEELTEAEIEFFQSNEHVPAEYDENARQFREHNLETRRRIQDTNRRKEEAEASLLQTRRELAVERGEAPQAAPVVRAERTTPPSDEDRTVPQERSSSDEGHHVETHSDDGPTTGESASDSDPYDLGMRAFAEAQAIERIQPANAVRYYQTAITHLRHAVDVGNTRATLQLGETYTNLGNILARNRGNIELENVFGHNIDNEVLADIFELTEIWFGVAARLGVEGGQAAFEMIVRNKETGELEPNEDLYPRVERIVEIIQPQPREEMDASRHTQINDTVHLPTEFDRDIAVHLGLYTVGNCLDNLQVE